MVAIASDCPDGAQLGAAGVRGTRRSNVLMLSVYNRHCCEVLRRYTGLYFRYGLDRE
jgi:hypothetical protein